MSATESMQWKPYDKLVRGLQGNNLREIQGMKDLDEECFTNKVKWNTFLFLFPLATA